MEIKNRDKIIEFYESEIYQEGFIKSVDLPEQMIKDLGETSIFASWMLATGIEEVKKSVREAVYKHMDKYGNKN